MKVPDGEYAKEDILYQFIALSDLSRFEMQRQLTSKPSYSFELKA
jgi:hypothetical protein